MKRLLIALLVFVLLTVSAAVAAFFLLVNPAPLTRGEYLGALARITVFRHSSFVKLDEREIKTLFRWSCTGKCHGAEPIETTRHTSREWQSIIERMRFKNGAPITARQQKVLVEYLLKNYGSNVPTILSPEANRFLKRYLWKSDFGESDLYVDVIYTPEAYFDILGGALEKKRHGAGRYTVFMVYLNTHQDRLKHYPLDEMALLKTPSGELKPVDWKLIYVSGDDHHMEGVLKFETLGGGSGDMELVLSDLPGQKERRFYWTLPIPDIKSIRDELKRPRRSPGGGK